jgi:uncharacterized membrane protein YhaH (DUF805 family)
MVDLRMRGCSEHIIFRRPCARRDDDNAVILACPIWMPVEIGFLRGTKGANSYGPDPLSAA